jgi:hypothetical protein
LDDTFVEVIVILVLVGMISEPKKYRKSVRRRALADQTICDSIDDDRSLKLGAQSKEVHGVEG